MKSGYITPDFYFVYLGIKAGYLPVLIYRQTRLMITINNERIR